MAKLQITVTKTTDFKAFNQGAIAGLAVFCRRHEFETALNIAQHIEEYLDDGELEGEFNITMLVPQDDAVFGVFGAMTEEAVMGLLALSKALKNEGIARSFVWAAPELPEQATIEDGTKCRFIWTSTGLPVKFHKDQETGQTTFTRPCLNQIEIQIDRDGNEKFVARRVEQDFDREAREFFWCYSNQEPETFESRDDLLDSRTYVHSGFLHAVTCDMKQDQQRPIRATRPTGIRIHGNGGAIHNMTSHRVGGGVKKVKKAKSEAC